MTRPAHMALKIALLDSGLPQFEVARLADVGSQKISHFIYGRRDLEPDERRRLARVLRRSERDLFPDERRSSHRGVL